MAQWTEYVLDSVESAERDTWPDDLTKYEREGIEPSRVIRWDGEFHLAANPRDRGYGTMLGVRPDGAPEPRKGDHIWLKGGGFGSMTEGIRVGAVTWWEKSAADLEHDRQVWLAVHARQQAQDFERNRPALDKRYAALLPAFQRRIDRFRAESPNFRAESEGYEMSPLSMATALIEWVKWPEFEVMLRTRDARLPKPEFATVKGYHLEPDMTTPDWEATPENLIRAFDALNSKACGYRYQELDNIDAGMKALTGLTVDPGVHSGNTWGYGIFFAIGYVNGGREF